MDPITALSLAFNVITFVDFAWELVSGAVEIYQSPTGRTTENIHVENVIRDLQGASDDLSISNLGDSKEAERLKQLALCCTKLAGELLDLLKKLSLEGKKIKLESYRPWSKGFENIGPKSYCSCLLS